MNDEHLDALLNAPLPSVADDGFSRVTLIALAQERKHAARIQLLSELGLFAAVMAMASMLPWDVLWLRAESLLPDQAAALTLGVALMLCWLGVHGADWVFGESRA